MIIKNAHLLNVALFEDGAEIVVTAAELQRRSGFYHLEFEEDEIDWAVTPYPQFKSYIVVNDKLRKVLANKPTTKKSRELQRSLDDFFELCEKVIERLTTQQG